MKNFLPVMNLKNWVEIVCFFLIIIGFIFSLTAGSAVMYYIISFLTGMFFGRLWYNTKGSNQFKYLIMIFFFMLGFVIGSIFTKYGGQNHTIITIFAYIIGILISYYTHSKGYFKAIDY